MADDVKLVLTENMKNAAIKLGVLKKERIFNEAFNQANEFQNTRIIQYRKVLKLFKEIRQSDPDKPFYLHEFMAGSSIYEEPPKIPEKSPELVKRLKKLQAEQDQKEYESMTKNISNKNSKSIGEELGAEVRSTSKQMVSVLNFLLTVFGCAFFAFFASQYAWDNLGLRVIFAVVTGCVVAMADLYFLARTEL